MKKEETGSAADAGSTQERAERKPPNPGSNEALDMGCRCAVLDNNHGRGNGPFWVTESCPLHGRKD